MNDYRTPAALLAVLDGIEPAALAAALSLMHPNDALLVAARLGVEMNEARREWRRTMREVSHQIHGGRVGYWARQAGEPSFEELQRRRGVETGRDGRPRGVRRPGDTRPDHQGAA